MVDWRKLADSANAVVKKRGGAKSVLDDASELAEIAQRDGSLSEKAKAAGAALKEPGKHHEPAPSSDQTGGVAEAGGRDQAG
ncbi:MAG: hypothetical protein WAL63_17280 [Solirubrobacteraceae bacterium]